MLITTSRKPSQRTRSFCKDLNRVIDSEYVNRGKMSLRNVLLKSSELGSTKTAVVSEVKGNPSRIDFYNENGNPIISLDVTVSTSTSQERVKKKDLTLQCEFSDLKKLVEVFDIPESHLKEKNLLLIKKGDNERKAVIEFYGNNGIKTGPVIYIKNWKL
jgi:U3 small nucleolar ribonucleoprotein protein IMP4